MLILIDPEFVDTTANARLLGFLRHPYTEDSCSLVDREIPEMSDAYRAMQCSKVAWPLAVDPQLAGHATSIFKPVASIEGRLLPLMSPQLSETQVVLLQEDLRDLIEGMGQSIPPKQGRRTANEAAFLALRGAALHEAAFLVLAGLFELRVTNQLLEFQLTEIGKSCMQSRVMGFTLEAQSILSLRWALLALIESLRLKLPVGGGSISNLLESYMLDMLVARLLDSQFSISTRMQRDHRVAALSRDAGALCRWFAVLEIARLAGEGAYFPDSAEAQRLDLDIPLLERILSSQKSALLSDRGIRQTPDGRLTLGDSSLEHAITCCKHVVLNDVACRELGLQFEEFVRSYIFENVATDYVVRKGISVSGKDKGEKYECDLILYEPKRRKVFFLQVKWKRDARTANLETELRNWRNKNWPMTKGVSQLVAIRSRLNESRILDQIRTSLGSIRLTDQEILENSHFIVVHTLPFFSGYLRDGVAIYEWNLFRNLLRRGATFQQTMPAGNIHELSEPIEVAKDAILPIEDPHAVLAAYGTTLGIGRDQYDAAVEARLAGRFGFDVALKTAPLWRRLSGRGRLRIVRPYI